MTVTDQVFAKYLADGKILPVDSATTRQWRGNVVAQPTSMQQPYRRIEFGHGRVSRIEVSACSDQHASQAPGGRLVLLADSAAAAATAQVNDGTLPPLSKGTLSARGEVNWLKSLQRDPPAAASPPATERKHGASTRHGYVGEKGRPSNRSEAVALVWQLNDKLAAVEVKDLHAQMAVHQEVFEEVVRQVSIHCGERGMLLDRLSRYYTHGMSVAVRMAERAVSMRLDKQITELSVSLLEAQEEAATLRVRELYTSLSSERATPETLQLGLRSLDKEQQKAALVTVLNEHATLLFGKGGDAKEQATLLLEVLRAGGGGSAAMVEQLTSILYMMDEEELEKLMVKGAGLLSESARMELMGRMLRASSPKVLDPDGDGDVIRMGIGSG